MTLFNSFHSKSIHFPEYHFFLELSLHYQFSAIENKATMNINTGIQMALLQGVPGVGIGVEQQGHMLVLILSLEKSPK